MYWLGKWSKETLDVKYHFQKENIQKKYTSDLKMNAFYQLYHFLIGDYYPLLLFYMY